MALHRESAITLYPYQRRYLEDGSRFKAGMWARQTGKTFTTTLEAVLDCLNAESQGRSKKWTIMSVSQARAQDAMDNGVKLHLRAFKAAFEALEVPFDADELAFEVRLPRGSRIRAIASKPQTARGMTENLILDEFAHHQDNRAIWTALLPVVSRPDLKLRVISTPNGKGDKFYEIMTSPDMEKTFSRYIVTIYDAIRDGLNRNVEELRTAMSDPDAWAQEFECKFVDEATAYITYEMIAQCEDLGATIEPPEGMVGEFYMGVDIGRKRDLTVMWLWEKIGDVLWTRMVKRLFREPFRIQREILFTYLPFVRRCCIDATGLGMQLAEEAQERFGSRVEAVTFTQTVKEDLAVTLRRKFEDRTIRIPIDREIRDDFHSIKKYVTSAGNIRFDAERSEAGHADHFWAAALGAHAAINPTIPIEYESISRRSIFGVADREYERAMNYSSGLSSMRGAW